MTAEAKLRTLASADAAMQTLFGTAPFRWFDVQLPPQYIEQGACVRVRRVSTGYDYLQSGLSSLNAPRFQIDALTFSGEESREAALAIIAFLGTICLATTNQFGSPQTTPPQFPTFVLNQRMGMEPNTNVPVFVTSLDVRLYNLEN